VLMKKTFTLLLAFAVAGAAAIAQPKRISRNAVSTPVNLKSLKAVPIEPVTQQTTVRPLIKKPTPPRTNTVDIVPLGTSLNPYGLIGGARPAVVANAATNSVAFIRRGGPENGATPAVFGSQYYYDLSTNGGSTFSLARGPIYDPTVRPGNPANGRYPQGVIYNPPGNTNPANAYVIATGAVLDGSNASGAATWGGFGYGIHKLDNTVPPVYKLQSSNDRFKYLISNSITVLPNGKAISVEENLPDGGNAQEDSLIITTLNITTSPMDISASAAKIGFPTFEFNISRPKIAFAPNGLVGYIAVVGAPADNSETKQVYVPMYSKTTDGGVTWSDPISIPLNPTSIPDDDFVDPTFSRVKQQLLGGEGDLIEFADEPGIEYRAFFSTTFEFDINVDALGNLHFLTPFMVGGWEGTEPALSVYPGIGAVITDLIVSENRVIFRPLKTLNYWRGCFGDCPSGTNRIVEANRPGVSRSSDGAKMFFGWFDSDTTLVGEPANTSDANLFPDFNALGYDIFADRWTVVRDFSGPSPAYGLLFLGNFASEALNGTSGGHILPVTYAATSDEILPDGSNLASLTTENYFLSGSSMEIPASAYIVVSNNSTAASINFNLYPNPTKQKAFITPSGDLGSTVKVTIVNSIGQVVKMVNNTERLSGGRIEVDMQNFNPGIYSCIVESNGKSKVSKFVKE